MTVEKILWTALPNHTDDAGRLRLSVMVSPRLSNQNSSSTQRELADFPSFVDWPTVLAQIGLSVSFDGGSPVEPVEIESETDPTLWKRVFPPATPVLPFSFEDHSQRNLHSFPVRHVLSFLESAYGELGAVDGESPPSVHDPAGPLVSRFGPLDGIVDGVRDSESFRREMEGGNGGKGKVVEETFGGPGTDANAVYHAYRYYYRPGSRRTDLPDIEASPRRPEFDFHQMVALLGDHPGLLRQLGLVVDLVFELPMASPATGLVRVVTSGGPSAGPPPPATRFELASPYFGARPRNTERFKEGLLNLTPELFDLYQVDVDGAAMKAADFGSTLAHLRDPSHRTRLAPDTAALPSMRSGGLAVARFGRAAELLEDLGELRDKNLTLEANADTVLDLEDLVRGYRVDVFDEDGPSGPSWYSLHERRVMLRIGDADSAEPPVEIERRDEGYVKGVVASSERQDHPSPSRDLYLHEALFGWDGWSLSAPRPGKRVVEPGEGDDGTHIADYDPAADGPLPVRSESRVAPGTLPRLRFGHRYRLRARSVDLAGNSLPFSRNDLGQSGVPVASESQDYLRYEPVASPTVLRRHPDTEGESLEHLVIRSDVGLTPAQYVAQPSIQAALAAGAVEHRYLEDSQRHLAAPKTSQMMSEQLGAMDKAFGGTEADIAAALKVALREEGTFLDTAVVDLASGDPTLLQPGQSFFPAGTSPPAERGAGLPEGAYVYYSGDEVLLPYLPDPLAVGLRITAFDRAGVEVLHENVMFDGDWPEARPFRLRLSEGPVGAGLENGVLEVRLPQAEVVQVRYSSILDGQGLDRLAVWRWVRNRLPGGALEEATEKALSGRHWMLTPFRTFQLTHSVQRPLEEPDSRKMHPIRALGQTSALFVGSILNHAKSTGRLDVMAQWTEDQDLLTDDLPRMRALGTEVPYRARAFGFDMEWNEDGASVTQFVKKDRPRISLHEFGDTRYRKVTYNAVATSRYREFFTTEITDDLENIQRVESTQDQNGSAKPQLIRHILSSARPKAPEVVYAVPTFAWKRTEIEGGGLRHRRAGKGLRVYLRRPWFSSGDGELLGVVLRNPTGLLVQVDDLGSLLGVLSDRPWTAARGLQPFRRVDPKRVTRQPAADERDVLSRKLGGRFSRLSRRPLAVPLGSGSGDPLEPYLTRWGSDPVWKSAPPDSSPSMANFPRHVAWAGGLPLEEVAPGRDGKLSVAVAGHEVHFDAERRLWYADIDIDVGNTYFPFVRLALARYQPNSLDGAHLSRVVTTDILQLTPDREAQVEIDGSAAHVEVTGYSGRNIVAEYREPDISIHPIGQPAPDPTTPNTIVRAALERRDGPSDLAWEQVGNRVTLKPVAAGFHVNWNGHVRLPSGVTGKGTHRLVVTESEEYIRIDLQPGDPTALTSPADLTRERIVYADVFEI